MGGLRECGEGLSEDVCIVEIGIIVVVRRWRQRRDVNEQVVNTAGGITVLLLRRCGIRINTLLVQACLCFFNGMCQVFQSKRSVVPCLDETRKVIIGLELGFVLCGDAAEGGVLVVQQGLVFRELGSVLRLGLRDYGCRGWRKVSMRGSCGR